MSSASEALAALRAHVDGLYRIDRELGGGGMSRVYLAEEIALERRVVLKVLAPDLAHMLSAERFEREVRVAARLQHPHIVPLLAAGRAGEALYYTMPLVEGESLRARIDRHGELSVQEATRLFREVADALAYAHRAGVVHRDVKPDNILLSHGHAMVMDFGVARAVSEAVSGGTLTHTGMAVGTPGYMSPEQAAAGPIDHRADLYALGVVAYEMLAGHAPFRGSTPQALVAAHMTQTPTRLSEARPSVPADLDAIVHRCLEKRAADRFETADALTAALDRITAAPTPQRATVSRRSMVMSAAGLGLVALGFGGAAALLPRRIPVAPIYRRLTFRRGLIRTARFSPDYQTVLYGALWDGDVSRVYSVRPDSPESSPLALPPAVALAVSGTGELALALGTHYRGIMTYGTLARVPLAGGAPRELHEDVKYADWSPDGQELAIIRRVGTGDQLEFPAGTVIAQPESPGGGFGFVRVSPRGDAVAVFELRSRQFLFGRVVVFGRDGVRRTVSERYSNLFGLAWHGNDVWFTAADQLPLFRNTMYAMRRSGEVSLVARVPGNTTLHDIAPDGRLLIARTDDRTGISVRPPGAVGERDFSWLDGTNIADISRDGRHVLFHEWGVGGGPHGTTYLRGTDGSPAVRLAEGLGHALSPDGRRAIVQVDGEPHVNLVPTGPGDVVRLARPGLTVLAAKWLADREQVVVRARTEGGAVGLFVLDIAGDAVRQLTPDALQVTATGWSVSPDGVAVAVSTGEEVALFSTAGGPARQVPGVVAGEQVIGWIDSGLLLSPDPLAGGVVHRVDPVTGRRDVWADITPQDPAGIMNQDLSTLVTTPDGTGYGYTWHRAISDLYLVEGLG